MTITITPVAVNRGDARPVTVSVGPDKSILHRVLILGSITRSQIHIPIESPEELPNDILATILALESLNVPIEVSASEIELQGVGHHGLRPPGHTINCANSGTTARLLMGLLAGQPFDTALAGDRSLSLRPMRRLADLLAKMGATIETSSAGTLPAKISGRPLLGTELTLPVASAQLKSAVLLAGLFAEGMTIVAEPLQSRDHTERLLTAFGLGDLRLARPNTLRLEAVSNHDLPEDFTCNIPGDISSAAFMAVAAVLLRRRVTIAEVSLNPTRTRFLDIMTLMGVEIEATNVREEFGESRGNLTIFGDRLDSALAPFEITAQDVPLLIDEVPELCVLAMFAEGTSSVRGARELRVKESDRLHLVANQLKAFGAQVVEFEDGLEIEGIPDRVLTSSPIEHGGDHRLAMAFAVAGLVADKPIQISDAEAVRVSYPKFFEHLRMLAGDFAAIRS